MSARQKYVRLKAEDPSIRLRGKDDLASDKAVDICQTQDPVYMILHVCGSSTGLLTDLLNDSIV